jgi:NTE family protein
MMSCRTALATACLLAAAAGLHAQPAGNAPRIGLALSGGGARGAAHIGVLQVLEELRVPVHCIAGTSMGAVIGGAYAAGNRPEAMIDLIAETDWNDVFNDYPPRGELSVRRKAEDYRGLFAPEFGLRDGALQVPKGVVAGVAIESFLRRLAAPSVAVDDFSRLPIPYAAVAADIATGEEVVLTRGSLARAMRASMAIPGAVSPIEIDGRMLVDGGIANNLPIDVVRSACADVVIAVNISTPPMKRSEITSAVSIVGQLVNLLGKQRVDQQLAQLGPRDVLVEPDLGAITAASFERQLEAAALGAQAARAAGEALARYSLPPADYAAWRRTQAATAQAQAPVDSIRFEGLERSHPDVLRELMQTRPGEALDDQRLAADVRRIYGRGDFEAVDYRIDQSPAGRALLIPVREKSTGPDYVRFGIGLAADFRDENRFNLLVSYRRTWLNRWGGEWLTEAQVGQTTSLFTEFYQPLQPAGRWFAAPYARVARTNLGVYYGDARVAEYTAREGRVGLDAGHVLGTWGELRAGVLTRQVEVDVSTGLPTHPEVSDRTTGVRLQLYGDTLDSPWFPRSGQRVLAHLFASTSTSGGVDAYRRLDASWTGALSRRAHTIALTASGGGGLGTRLPVYEGFTLGGPFRLSGYPAGRFAGEHYGLLSARYYNEQMRLPSILGSGAYLGASLEAGRMSRQFSGEPDTGTVWSGSVFLSAVTFIGPVFLGVGFARGGRGSLYLVVGAP